MDQSDASDHQTSVGELRKAVAEFVEERSWHRYHTPKNLAMSIAIEAAEIMERFQWHSPEESVKMLQDAESCSEVADELADVLIYCIALANQADIDVSRAVRAKLANNASRFPIGYMPT